jgi:hypothetical protein
MRTNGENGTVKEAKAGAMAAVVPPPMAKEIVAIPELVIAKSVAGSSALGAACRTTTLTVWVDPPVALLL